MAPTASPSTPLSPALLHTMHALQADRTLWGPRDIQQALGLNDRTSLHYLRVASKNYTDRGLVQWPPNLAALRKPIPVAEGIQPACLSRWPAHPHVRPPPLAHVGDSTSPQWYAGDVRRWAMKTGRMALDGTALLLTPHGPTRTPGAATSPDLSEVDFDLRQRLVDDDAPWKLADVTKALEVTPGAVWHWYRATRNMVDGRNRCWPPPVAAARRVAKPRGSKKNALRTWPPHHRVLPPPDRYDDDTPVWRAGTIRLWAMKTGRMALDGTIIRDAYRRAA